MKLMLLGDSHGNTHFVEQAIDLASERGCEAIIQLGDFGIWDHTHKGTYFLDRVNQRLREHQISLLFIDGNHENFDSLENNYPVGGNGFREVRSWIAHAPRGHRFEVTGVRFMAFGGAHSIDGPGGPPFWVQARGPVKEGDMYAEQVGRHVSKKVAAFDFNLGHWWPQETIKREEVDAVEPVPVDVLLSHDCPAGIRIPGINGYPAGDEQRALLREVVDKVQPQLVVHGHYHRFHQGELDNGTHVVGLAADVNKSGQYCFIDTDPFQLHVPRW